MMCHGRKLKSRQVQTALLKLVAGAALACIACWLIADPLVRLPGVRRIV
jgi:hypothetical protein